MKEKKIRISVRDITLMAMLIAIEIVLSRFCSIQAWNVKIGFAFIAPVTAAILMGPHRLLLLRELRTCSEHLCSL